MMTLIIAIGAVLAGSSVAGVTGWYLSRRATEKKASQAGQRVQVLVAEAEKKAAQITKEGELSAKEYLHKARTEFEQETKVTRREVQEMERQVLERQSKADHKLETLQNQETELRKQDRELEERRKKTADLEAKYNGMLEESRQALERAAGLSRDEAKKEVVASVAEEAKLEAAKMCRMIEEQAKEEANGKAKKMISFAIERMAGEWVQERSVSTVHIPSDDMKGRIIGREGRNIRCLEAATGVDFIIDDTPGAVVLSSHNPIRRELARVTLERLLEDGRIHPARIEELVQKVTGELEQSIREAGQQALLELEINGVHPEIAKLLGGLKYRYSYAQNVLQHSKEVGFMAGMMASELGLNPKVARRAGLLHDIGKAISHEIPGSHAVIGGQFAKKYGEAPEVWHAIWAHHEDLPQDAVLDNLVDAADALSGARPGARMESQESYVKRLEDLEKIAMSFNEVEKAFGIQAGRELRVMVQPDKITDEKAYLLCKDISKRIEKELTYPGQIKVTVIRETRAVDFAR